MNVNQRKELLLSAIFAVLKAGDEIMQVYDSEDFGVQFKSDKTPLTLADQKAHNCIIKELNHFNIPILSEEGEHQDYEVRKNWEHCWIIDPLDGTKEFIKRNGEFTVNIALVERQKSIMGVIYLPVQKQLYFGDLELGAYRIDQLELGENDLDLMLSNALRLPLSLSRNSFRVLASKSHMNEETRAYIAELKEKHPNLEQISRGSSLKLCLIAEKQADIYPRFSPTMEWDIAAGHAIVAASGARVFRVDTNEELIYNKENLLNPWFICERWD